MIIFIEGAPKKTSKKWSSSLRSLRNQKKSITIIKQNACQKWSPSLRGLQSPPKKVASSWSANACQKWSWSFRGLQSQKKVSSALNRFYGKNDHFHRGGSTKTSKTDHNPPKKVSSWLNRFHVIACQKWSLSSKGLKSTSKHLKKKVIFFGHYSPPSLAFAKWIFVH